MPVEPYQPTERRPIAARSWLVLRLPASWLARHRGSPNAISSFCTLARLVAGACLAETFFSKDARFLWLAAGLLIVVRALANLLDGMVAVESNRASPRGELFNDVPDRISDATIFIGLGFAKGSDPLLGFGAALAAVFTAYA